MSVEVFLIGVLLFAFICTCIVLYEWRKGNDWKICAMVMLFGFLITVSQLAGAIK